MHICSFHLNRWNATYARLWHTSRKNKMTKSIKFLTIIFFLLTSLKGNSQKENSMEWEKYLLPIYDKLKVVEGTLNHTITNEPTWGKGLIYCISMTMKTDSIEYLDPYYGENTLEEIWFETYNSDGIISINNLKEIENKEFIPKKGELKGSFSNSLDLAIHKFKFGKIENNTIELTFEFYLTNPFGTSALPGTLEDHIKYKKEIKVLLKIDDLLFEEHKSEIGGAEHFVDSKYYDVENKYLGDFGTSYPDGRIIQYRIPVKYK